MKIQLSEHFDYKKLLRFVVPSIFMMIFTSVYGVVDGLFVSNFVGKTAFTAINLIWPAVYLLSSIGFMVGTGGSALVSKTMGQGNYEKANRYFSMLIYVALFTGCIVGVPGFIFTEQISMLLKAEGDLLDCCVRYGRILFLILPFGILQVVFQSFFVVAERPHLGLFFTLAAGIGNIVLDALFIGVFHWGLEGAALATAASQVIGGAFPLFYFMKKSAVIHLTKTGFYVKPFFKACTNGASEMMTNISLSLINVLYNYELMKIAGEDGVAAYGVLMYVGFIFISVFVGYSIGVAPIVGFNHGSENHTELQNILRKSLAILSVLSVSLTAFAEIFARPLAAIFVSYDRALLEMSVRGLCIYSLCFLIVGFNIFASGFFTALNNGFVSALLSFLRTFVFQVLAIFLFSFLWGLDGIWSAVIFAELISLLLSAFCLIKYRKRYHYI